MAAELGSPNDGVLAWSNCGRAKNFREDMVICIGLAAWPAKRYLKEKYLGRETRLGIILAYQRGINKIKELT